MTEVLCRDCGRLGNEAPDDPAPALCPPCYERRLHSIGERFAIVASLQPDPVKLAAWLERELRETGGETPAFARKHATSLLFQAALLTADVEYHA